MSCTEFTEGTLSDYTDRALSVGDTWRVRFHLRRCSACAATVFALQSLSRDARGLYVTGTVSLPKPRRRLQVMVRPLLAGAAVAALALWFAPEMPGRPRVAFAEVEDAMRRIQTAQWRASQVIFDGGGNRKAEFSYQHWAQTEPLMDVWRTQTVFSRTGPSGPSTDEMMRFTEWNSVLRYPKNRWSCVVVTDAERAKGIRLPVERSIHLLLFPQDAATRTVPMFRPGTSKSDSKETWQQEMVLVKGRSLLLFHHTYTAPLLDRTDEIWVDPGTRRLFRRVSRHTYYQKSKSGERHRFQIMVNTTDNFRYNEPIPQEVLHFGEAQIKTRLAEREAAERAGVPPPPIP